jgi:single-stranded-DNA-specific exonuclease
VALGTVVDIVPLIDENRIMVKYGMNKLFKSEKAGFQALLQETGLKKGVTAYHLGFIIGPRVNACGRLHDAKEALELFLTHDTKDARERARNLSRHNTQRQSIEARVYHDAKILVEKKLKEDRIIVAGQEGWHPGVVGIVASKISEEYYRPVILLALEHDVARGSARSIAGFDITSALSTCQDVLTTFGGHARAAGLELERRQISALRTCINEYALTIDDSVFQEKKMYDLKLDLNEISDEVVHFLKFFEPTGIANPQPVFLGEGLEVVGVPRVVGTNHLKCSLRKNGAVFPAIAYGKADDILNIEVGKTKVDCLYSVSEDSFLGKKKVVLKIRDMRRAHEE